MSASRASEAQQGTNRVALDALLNRLARWEDSSLVTTTGPTYREMCRAANETAAEGSRQAAAKRQAEAA